MLDSSIDSGFGADEPDVDALRVRAAPARGPSRAPHVGRTRHGRPVDERSVLGKIIVILQAFHADDHGVSLGELQGRTQLPKATLYRLLCDLIEVGLIDRGTGGFRLGSHLFELGMRAAVERRLLEVGTPFMEDLYERTHETVHLGIPVATEVVYIAKIGGHRQATVPSRVGGRMPMYCTAIGKALLAFLPEERFSEVVAAGMVPNAPRTLASARVLHQQLQQVAITGVAFEYEESARGIVCAASPVLNHAGEAVAALSVSGPITRFRPDRHVDALLAASAGTASALRRRAGVATS